MADMSLLSERIRYLLDQHPDVNRSKLAKIAGVQPSAVTAWVNGNAQRLTSKSLMRLSEYFKVSPQWLESGIGTPDMPILPLESIQVLDDDEKLKDDDPWVEIEEFNQIEFGCGPGPSDPSWEQEHDKVRRMYRTSWLRKRGFRPEMLKTTHVCGDSMEPTLSNGDAVTINLDDRYRIQDNAIYAFVLNGEMLIKRLSRSRLTGDITIKSDNKDYGTETYKADDETNTFKLIGRVVEYSGSSHLE